MPVLLILTSGLTHGGDDGAAYSSAAEIGTFCDRLPRPAYAAFELHPASDEWFEVYAVEPRVWAIYEPFQWQEVISYLIEGEDAAILFDTGNGIGDIAAVVERLTDKPIMVINSHNHYDHIGGNYQFDSILSVGTDFSLSKATGATSDSHRAEVSPEALCKPLPDGVDPATHGTRAYRITRKIVDGETLDLGGRTLEVIRIPGHTDDSVALLDRANGLLWSGDSFYAGPIWLFAPETDLVAYRESVAKLAALAPGLNAVLPAHNTPKADPGLLIELHRSLQKVLAGDVEPVSISDDHVEFRFENFSFLLRKDYGRL